MSNFTSLCASCIPDSRKAMLKDCEGNPIYSGDSVARCSDIPTKEEYSLVTVTPTGEGNPITTINVDGVDFVVEESITAITNLEYATGTSTLTVTFRDETGAETETEVEIPVEVAIEHISPVVIDPNSTYTQYVDKIVVDAEGNFYGFNLAGEPTKLNITQTVTTMTDVLTSGHPIGTYTNEDDDVVVINESVTGLTAVYDPLTKSVVITHTNENGAQPAISVDISTLYPDTSISERGLVNLVSLQHLGDGDKLINGVRIGNGGSDLDANTVVGRNAMYNITTGVGNTGVGNQVLRAVTTGGSNTVIGSVAGVNITTGQQNTAIGAGAMGNTSGTVSRLTAVGNASLNNNTTGTVNAAVGWQALFANTTGSNNIAFGDQALRNNTTGNQNVAIGASTLLSNNGNGNLAIGQAVLFANTSGSNNTGLGSYALFRNTTGFNNMAFGNNAMAENTTGLNNTAVGTSALRKNNANFNTAVGNNAMYENVSGVFNTAVGNNVMYANTSGQQNVAIGDRAMINNTAGQLNVAVGRNALASNTVGQRNTAVGMGAMGGNTTAFRNVGIGNDTLANNTTGSDNTAVGTSALNANTSQYNTTGIGYNAQVTGSNQVQIGNAGTTTYVYGTVQNRSDARDKTDIVDTAFGLDFIKKLRAVDYRWDLREDYRDPMPVDGNEQEWQTWVKNNQLRNVVKDGSKKRARKHHGIIAQELKELMESSGYDFGGLQDHSLDGGDDVLSVGYDEFIAPLIKAVQELSAKVEILEAKLKGQ